MINLDFDAQIATAVLDRPPVNAISEEWIARLERVLDEVEAHGGISVIHFRSALKTFCAGADLKTIRDLTATPEGRDEMIGIVRRLQMVLNRLERLGAVSIAEIGGAALGGGLELALACDLRVASETAKLGLPEARLGLLPGAGGTQRLPRICGDAIARRLILGAEIVDGREAARIGLVQWAVPPEGIAERTRELVQRVGALPPQALAACKACIGMSHGLAIDGSEQELLETRKLHDVRDTRERVRAFLEGVV